MTVINSMREENKMIVVELEPGQPHGLLPERTLWKRTIIDDNDREFTVATEYRQTEDGPVVHRSAAVQLKIPAVFAEAQAGSFV